MAAAINLFVLPARVEFRNIFRLDQQLVHVGIALDFQIVLVGQMQQANEAEGDGKVVEFLLGVQIGELLHDTGEVLRLDLRLDGCQGLVVLIAKHGGIFILDLSRVLGS